MQISYFPQMHTCLIDDRKILLIAKLPIEGPEEKIKSGINFYKNFLNCDIVLKSNNEPNIWFFGQEIKLANFTDIIEAQHQQTEHKTLEQHIEEEHP